MENFILALEENINNENWYGAIFIALTLPDICGKIEYPNLNSSQKRYSAWFDKYLGSMYSKNVGGSEHNFLSGSDCYALRCALLHEGSEDITEQKAQETLERFHFPKPSSLIMHRKQSGTILQIQVDLFALELIKGIKQWLAEIETNVEKQNKLSKLLKVYEINNI